MLNEYANYQQERIERDISSFADPGTRVDVKPGGGRGFRATWTMRGDSREAMFSVSLDHGISVTAHGQKRSYDEFLAGEQMANLRNVAEMIKQSSERGIFVSTKARRTDHPRRNQDPRPAAECLIDLMEEPDADSTRVIMVTGEAGAGKTQVLQELVRRQADNYLRGKTHKLFLYVNAQGRALARLNEALATELQDLRVSLTYHSVATLGHLRDVTLRQCSLISVSMRRTDLSRTRFVECRSQDTLLVEPMVKIGGTKFDVDGLDVRSQVVGINVLGDEDNKTVYDPYYVADILGKCGFEIESIDDSDRDVPKEKFDVLDRLMRAYGRANPVCEADDNLKNIFAHESWSDVRRLLIKHGIVASEERQTGGHRKRFLRRRFLTEEIMRGASKAGQVHPQIIHFWDDLEGANNRELQARAAQ